MGLWYFYWLNPSGRAVSLVSTQSNRNEYQIHSLGGKGGRCVGLTTLPPSRTDCLKVMAVSTFWSPYGLVQGELYLHHNLTHRNFEQGVVLFTLFIYLLRIRNSVIGIAATLCRLDLPGFEPRPWQETLPFSKTPRPALKPIQPPIKGYRSPCPGVKWPGRVSHHLSPSRVEVKKKWSHFSYMPSWRRQGHLYLDLFFIYFTAHSVSLPVFLFL